MRYVMALLVVLFAVVAVAGEPVKKTLAEKKAAAIEPLTRRIWEVSHFVDKGVLAVKMARAQQAEGKTLEQSPEKLEASLKECNELLAELKLKMAYLKGEVTIKSLEDKVKAAQAVADTGEAAVTKKEAELKQAQELASKEGAFQYQKDAVVRVQAELKPLRDKKAETDKALEGTKKDLDTIKKLEAELAPPPEKAPEKKDTDF